jgi:hypothetical protein
VAIGSSTAGQALIGSVIIAGGSGVTPLLTGVSATTWILKSNGATCLALAKQVAGTTPNIYVSNGGSFSTNSLSSVLAPTETPIDIAWSANKNLWLMAISVSDGQTRFMASLDGVTWVKLGSVQQNIAAIIASGSYWVAVNSIPAGLGAVNSQILISPDGVPPGGISWYMTQTFLFPVGGAQVGQLVASPTQLGLYVPQSSGFGLYRFSLEAALPDLPLT